MELIRKPYQGVWNIVKFNWHFYVIAISIIVLLFVMSKIIPSLSIYFLLTIALIVVPIIISLLVSYYVYDLSGLYCFDWIENTDEQISVVNINAGFDETSLIIKNKFKNSTLYVFDFYDPEKHTEVSIARARKAYPSYNGTIQISTAALPLQTNSIDKIFLIFAAHEIRNNEERIIFFKEAHRVLKNIGELIVVEHLRDTANFMAYNIGFFHFLSKKNWFFSFTQSGLIIKNQIKVTPFITYFTLKKNVYTL